MSGTLPSTHRKHWVEERPCASRASPQGEAGSPLSTAVGAVALLPTRGWRVSLSLGSPVLGEPEQGGGRGMQTPPFGWGRGARGVPGARAVGSEHRIGRGDPVKAAQPRAPQSWLRGPRRRRQRPARVQSAPEQAGRIPPQPPVPVPVPERQILKPQPRQSLWPDLEDFSLMPVVARVSGVPKGACATPGAADVSLKARGPQPPGPRCPRGGAGGSCRWGCAWTCWAVAQVVPGQL